MRLDCSFSNGDDRFLSQLLLSHRARLSVFQRLSSALYRMDAVVTLHTSDNYGSTPQTRH